MKAVVVCSLVTDPAAIVWTDISACLSNRAPELSTGSTVTERRANGIRVLIRAVEPNPNSPSSRSASIPEICGDRTPRTAVMILYRHVEQRSRARCANSGAPRSRSRHAVTRR